MRFHIWVYYNRKVKPEHRSREMFDVSQSPCCRRCFSNAQTYCDSTICKVEDTEFGEPGRLSSVAPSDMNSYLSAGVLFADFGDRYI
jgi:hypothetical protein